MRESCARQGASDLIQNHVKHIRQYSGSLQIFLSVVSAPVVRFTMSPVIHRNRYGGLRAAPCPLGKQADQLLALCSLVRLTNVREEGLIYKTRSHQTLLTCLRRSFLKSRCHQLRRHRKADSYSERIIPENAFRQHQYARSDQPQFAVSVPLFAKYDIHPGDKTHHSVFESSDISVRLMTHSHQVIHILR